ncbi:putative leucine-rich repeat receptor-like protein kinase family protein isoform X1 [Iris pallida]|uniref:non-specific serine/threonine protein kinase n=1 Tax=Iris pallida TaxID=29817 RepID=A0AAX6GTQ0_IRIPA|nr:putative leucine-rich repeat receptor-like protein kinase family protein isoform X1 [Iris pallida]
MGEATRMILIFMFVAGIQVGLGATDSQDAVILRSLMSEWQNTPPSWGKSNDPCGAPWDGVVCNGSRVTMLKLPNAGIKGTLSGDIGQLTLLESLDLSYNPDLGGPLTPNIGRLQQLGTLILSGCSFTGSIPQELGNLPELSFVALNSNKFSGKIPPSIGKLSKLYWLDLADNQISGSLPVATKKSPGLDSLLNAKHFHFNKNQLSGKIPESIFSDQMQLIHVLFDSNKLTGSIPESVGLAQSLEVLRLDGNSLDGSVPSSISNLTRVNELNLANNKLSGPIPDLIGMNSLNYLDLSNNSFDAATTPTWFSKLQSLAVLVVESGGLLGKIPTKMFSLPGLQQVLLMNNAFNGTLNMGDSFSSQLTVVNFQNNSISAVTLSDSYKETLILVGNPVCNANLANTIYCSLQQRLQTPYSTNIAQCGPKACAPDQSVRPQNCDCAYPYHGVLIFRAPFFRDVTNITLFQQLETNLWTKLELAPGLVFLENPFFDGNNYLQVQLKLFPSRGMYFDHAEVLKIAGYLSNQTFKPPHIFGPYIFIGSPYPFPDGNGGGGSSMSTGAIAGIAIGCAVLIIGLVVVGIYAFRQKKRAEKAIEQSKPFASWGSGGTEVGGVPQLKGSRWFSFEELKKSTNNFSEVNEIGSGGFGQVYRGMLSDGQMVAIKRAGQGSTQGGLEFKTEIELLSRVHHKNLVGLVGFCFEQGEQMLVYEFIPNGTLRESLRGKSGIQLDWKKRLRIALSSARGLAYLHELANPPIIHRDVKSTNILLDENLNAKVADFGLSKLVSDAQKGHVSTQVKGTLGYLDPEYYMTQQLTEKSDVYSFGVVMLELITARQPIEKGKYIVREVRMAMDENEECYGLKQIMDPTIQNKPNLSGFKRFVELAMQCVEESAADRPTMNEIVKEIELMLQDSGSNSNPTSAASSTTDFGKSKGALDVYSDTLTRKDVGSDAFEYSGGHSFVPKVEPK